MAGGQPDPRLVSCTECRRRKAKCDKINPCGLCAKSGRQCVYETTTRTPLSRKRLNDVEEELAQTKRRLAQYESSTNSDQLGAGPRQSVTFGTSRPNHENHSDMSHSMSPFYSAAQQLSQQQPLQSDVQFQSAADSQHTVHDQSSLQQSALQRQPSAHQLIVQQSMQMSQGLGHGSMQNSMVSTNYAPKSGSNLQNYHVAELPNPFALTQPTMPPSYSFVLEKPHAPEGFEWDERDFRSRVAGPSDGMASLTESTSRGYMGVASGAALLHLAGEPDDDSNGHTKNEPEKSRAPSPSPIIFSSASQLEPFVNAYFNTYHRCYPLVHEATFRAQFMEIIPQPKSTAWQVLLHVIAAIGAFASADCDTSVDQALFKAAKARLSIDMLETGNLTMVQALTLLSNYSQKRNKPNSGYNYLGLAKRMAMGIGLHKEFPTWRAKPLVLEMRRRLWWLLYIFDVGAVITFSRPLDLPLDGIEVQLPLNVHDRDITPMTESFPEEVKGTTLYTHVRCQTSFHLATNSIYTRMISSPYPTADQMLELDDVHLVKYESTIPPWYRDVDEQPVEFRLSCAIMRWRCHNFRILMLRAFLMRQLFLRTQLGNYQDPWPSGTPNEEQAVQRCLTASSESIDSICVFWVQNKQNVLSCWYALYFLFQAVLIPVMCLRNEPFSPLSDSWRSQIRRTIDVLNDMTRLNEAGAKCLKIINSLCGVFLTDEHGPSPINESPQTQLNNLYSYMWPLSDAQMTSDFALQDFPIQDLLNQIGGDMG